MATDNNPRLGGTEEETKDFMDRHTRKAVEIFDKMLKDFSNKLLLHINQPGVVSGIITECSAWIDGGMQGPGPIYQTMDRLRDGEDAADNAAPLAEGSPRGRGRGKFLHRVTSPPNAEVAEERAGGGSSCAPVRSMIRLPNDMLQNKNQASGGGTEVAAAAAPKPQVIQQEQGAVAAAAQPIQKKQPPTQTQAPPKPQQQQPPVTPKAVQLTPPPPQKKQSPAPVQRAQAPPQKKGPAPPKQQAYRSPPTTSPRTQQQQQQKRAPNQQPPHRVARNPRPSGPIPHSNATSRMVADEWDDDEVTMDQRVKKFLHTNAKPRYFKAEDPEDQPPNY